MNSEKAAEDGCDEWDCGIAKSNEEALRLVEEQTVMRHLTSQAEVAAGGADEATENWEEAVEACLAAAAEPSAHGNASSSSSCGLAAVSVHLDTSQMHSMMIEWRAGVVVSLEVLDERMEAINMYPGLPTNRDAGKAA